MNLTIGEVSKLTKLRVPTLYAYASRKKLGKKVGNKRFFTQADVQKILKGLRKPPSKKKAKSPAKETRRRAVKVAPIVARRTAASFKPTTVAVKFPKPSFWNRLFGDRKQWQKVSLMDAKTTR